MGCSIAASARPASSPLRNTNIANRTVGMVAICPKASSVRAPEVRKLRVLLRVPTPAFNLFRAWTSAAGSTARR